MNQDTIVDPHYIYFIFDGKYFKIGRSKNPRRRLYSLQVGCSERHLYIGALIRLPNKSYASILEKELHDLLTNQAGVHVRGEWFDLLDERHDFLKACFLYCITRVTLTYSLDVNTNDVFYKYYDKEKKLLNLVDICFV